MPCNIYQLLSGWGIDLENTVRKVWKLVPVCYVLYLEGEKCEDFLD